MFKNKRRKNVRGIIIDNRNLGIQKVTETRLNLGDVAWFYVMGVCIRRRCDGVVSEKESGAWKSETEHGRRWWTAESGQSREPSRR